MVGPGALSQGLFVENEFGCLVRSLKTSNLSQVSQLICAQTSLLHPHLCSDFTVVCSHMLRFHWRVLTQLHVLSYVVTGDEIL